MRQHLADALGLRWLGLGEARGEPAGDGGIAQVDHGLLAALEHGVDTGVPHLVVGDLGGGIAQGQAVQALTCMDTQPLADQASHRQADEVSLLNVQAIEQGQHVTAQLFDAVRAFSDQRPTVATGVVAQHAQVLAPQWNLRVPHAQVGTERVGQDQHRGVFRAIDLVIQNAIGQLQVRHSGLLQAVKR
ncbi:hypothetical protein D3C71_1620020 [compost metagenome]